MTEALALILFIVAMVASPGPANVLIFALGTKQDFKKSVSFLLSVVLSKQLIIWPIGFGVMLAEGLREEYFWILTLFSLLFISWMGYKIAFSDFSLNNNTDSWSPRFYHGLLVHPLNPKAWAMVSLSFTLYQRQEVTTLTILWLAITFFFIQLIFHSVWFLAGSVLRKSDFIDNRKGVVQLFLVISLFLSIIFTFA